MSSVISRTGATRKVEYLLKDRLGSVDAVRDDRPARADGRLGLRDELTGWRVELMGFGDTNRDAFLALLN